MKFFVYLLAIGLTTADTLDRTYLPPPGSKYSGGQPGDLQTPLEYGFSTTRKPQGSLTTRFPSIPVSSDAQSNAQKIYNIPTTTTSYAFSQTTTYSPIEGIDGNTEGIPENKGQTLGDQNANLARPNFFQTDIPQQVGITTGKVVQRPGFQFQPSTSSVVGSQGQPITSGGREIIPGFGGTFPNTGISPTNVVYDQNGNPIRTYLPSYGLNVPGSQTTNRPIDYGSTLTLFDKNGNPTAVQYDQNGNFIPKIFYDKDRKPVIVKIDQNRNIIPQALYDENGNPARVNYDKDGNIVPQTLYEQNGKPVFVNKNGIIGTQIFYDRNGKPISLNYDKNGKIIPQIYYDKSGKPITVKFDQFGNTLPDVLYDRNRSPARINYDQDGKIIPQTLYDETGKPVQLDENGNILRQPFYDLNGNLISKNYDQNGNLQQIIYDRNGKPIIIDKNGNIVQQTLYDRNGNPAEIKYDQNGNIIPQTFYDQNGKPISLTKNGFAQQTLFDQNGNPAQIKYDQNGNIVPEIFYDENGKPIQFDKNGMIIPAMKFGVKQPFIRPERPQAEADRNAYILNYENVLTPEGFSYSFDTSNGIHADESGTAIDGVKAQGAFSYIGDDGKVYSVIYSADENGFLPRGDHLPTPPPTPEAILRVIEEAKKAKEAGIIDDGSYDDNKYGYKKYQGPIERYRPSNRDKIYDANGNLIKRPVTSSTFSNNSEDRIDYIEEDVNEKGDIIPGYKKEQGSGSPIKGQNVNNREYNGEIKSIDSQLTKGPQILPRPRIPEQPSKVVQSNSGQEFQVSDNPDGSISVVPISGSNQLAKESEPNQTFNSIVSDNRKLPQFTYEQGQGLSNIRRPQEKGMNDRFTYGVNDRPTSQYKGYEYLVPVKAFEVGGKDKVGTLNEPTDINKASSTAKPFVTQPDDTTDSEYQKYGDVLTSPRPSDVKQYATTYKPTTISELEFSDKISPGTTSLGSIGSTPATRFPFNQDNYPSTTYRPKYSVIKGSQGENILVDEYGRPAYPSTQGYSGTVPSYAVTQRVPGPEVTFDDSGRPVQTGPQPGLVTVTPQTTVDAFGRPLPQTVDAYGRPIVVGSNQVNLVPGSPDDNINKGLLAATPSQSVTPGPQQQRIIVDQYGRPVISTKDGENGIKFIGEDFSGPRQKQRFDPKTGYYY